MGMMPIRSCRALRVPLYPPPLFSPCQFSKGRQAMPFSRLYPIFSLLCFFLSCPVFHLQYALAQAVNRTIDDTLGDLVTGQAVQYLPSSSDPSTLFWRHADQCSASTCAVTPDKSQTSSNTWTGGTFFAGRSVTQASGTMSFKGTDVICSTSSTHQFSQGLRFIYTSSYPTILQILA